jgi:hypothetical protein
VLFYEAMQELNRNRLAQSFELFERAAAKGHEESIWILSVVKDVERKKFALIEAFTKTEEPLGYYFAGELSYGEREEFDFRKKSAEAGCSWAQVAYGDYFRRGDFVEQDQEVYVEWLEKAANQNNPWAMYWLGDWFRYGGGDKQKAVSYYRAGAELGVKGSMESLAEMLLSGEGCGRDLREAVIWSAKASDSYLFWDLLGDACRALGSGSTESLECDFDQLCYSLGWGLYWYQYETGRWKNQSDERKVFGSRFLDYYCSCIELQQKSFFTFLWFWNRTTGVKGPGQMIAQMVWEQREDNLVKMFDERDEEEPETKRIKK